MPTYEYECQKCGHRFEEFQSMKDAPLTKCPECKGKVKRLIGAGAGFLFKGSGFYITDYAHKNIPTKEEKARDSKPADKPVEKAPEKTGAKSEARTESAKPAAKKDTSSASAD